MAVGLVRSLVYLPVGKDLARGYHVDPLADGLKRFGWFKK